MRIYLLILAFQLIPCITLAQVQTAQETQALSELDVEHGNDMDSASWYGTCHDPQENPGACPRNCQNRQDCDVCCTLIQSDSRFRDCLQRCEDIFPNPPAPHGFESLNQ